jgi:hypothetical protein
LGRAFALASALLVDEFRLSVEEEFFSDRSSVPAEQKEALEEKAWFVEP